MTDEAGAFAPTASSERRESVFAHYPRTTLGLLLPLLLMATDLGFTTAYQWGSDLVRREEPRLRVRSEIFHHTFAPKISVVAERWGPRSCVYRTNSLGFRDRVVRDVPLVGPGRRVVFMGDSFTEGVGVPYERTFVGLTSAALEAQGVEVLNGAVSLYSPTIYERKTRWLIEDVGLRFDELVVFIDISDILDETAYSLGPGDRVFLDGLARRHAKHAAERWERGPSPIGRFLHAHTLLLARLDDVFEGLGERPLHYGSAWTFDARAFTEYGRAGLAHARERMDALAALLASHGIRLVVAVYPWPEQILVGDRVSLQVRFWTEWAQPHGVPLIDYFPLFMGREPPADTVRRYFIQGDAHWNEEGHRLVAERLLAVLSAPWPS